MWQAQYYNGLTAARLDVMVKLSPDSLQIIKKDQGVVNWPLGEITAHAAHHAGEAMRLERGREKLNVPSPDFPAAFKAASPAHASKFGTPKTRKKNLIYAGAITALAGLLVSLYLWIIPFAADYAAAIVPPAWEARLGSSIADDFSERFQVCENPLAVDRVNAIVSSLDAAAQPHPYKFKVSIIKFPMVNALAAPGGYIIVFSGLLEKTERPEELAGVLAHEMQHVLKRHATRSIFHNVSTYMLVTLLTGGSSSAGGIVNTFTSMRYSQANETEADDAGLGLLQKAAIDPSGMVDFFKTMEKEEKHKNISGILSYVSTHPETAERIQRLNAAIAAHPSATATKFLLPDMKWKDVATACSEVKGDKPVDNEMPNAPVEPEKTPEHE